ncbi:MAG: hypothetical protein HQK81_12745 [Desulfovibrionaceae bacterium]|nr:hypothetical protein [Desulfovibrionaceae bacterium]MBF0514912.1 hypothetical protein [Desulfovibrionaceae bacterium]
MKKFLNASGYIDDFENLTPGSPEFDAKWAKMSKNPDFIEKQKQFVYKDYSEARDYMTKIYGIDPNDDAGLANSVFSLAVQQGAGGAKSILNTVLANNPNPSASDLASSLYDERMRVRPDGNLAHFYSSTPEVQQSIYNRLQDEKQKALRLVGFGVDRSALPARAYRQR